MQVFNLLKVGWWLLTTLLPAIVKAKQRTELNKDLQIAILKSEANLQHKDIHEVLKLGSR